jgi:Tol biopolymer transport system component
MRWDASGPGRESAQRRSLLAGATLMGAIATLGFTTESAPIGSQSLVHGVPPAVADSARVFADGIISTGHEFTVTFTPDGREVYFTRSDPNTHRSHILHAVRTQHTWQPPQPISFATDSASDLDPALSPDGRRLFFVSTRPRPGTTAGPARDMDIWYADRTSNGWDVPHWIPQLSSDGKEGSPTVDRHGTLCFFSDRGNAANQDVIYCAARTSDGYASPARLPGQINAGPSDVSPFLSRDGQTMLFYSTRPGGFGQADLYIAHRRGTAWSQSVNLGTPVNTDAYEYNPSVSPDGHTLYFGRNRKIWSIPLRALDSKVIAEKMFK